MSSYSIRNENRKRREYLYRKNVQRTQKKVQQKKDIITKATEEGKEIPTHLRPSAAHLASLAEYDDLGPQLAVELGGEAPDLDDEYRSAGVDDPKLIITTSRDPSSKLKQFVKELKLLFPNSQRMNRGNCEISTLVDAAKAHNFTDIVMVHETRGKPDCMIVSHLPNGPTAFFTLADVVMRHDIPDIDHMSQQYPNLIFHNFKTTLGERVKSILKYLFPVPKDDSKRLVTFLNYHDWILFRHHARSKQDKKDIIQEIGPRFSMYLYKIILGCIDQEKGADIDFILRPFMNSARKKMYLSDVDAW